MSRSLCLVLMVAAALGGCGDRSVFGVDGARADARGEDSGRTPETGLPDTGGGDGGDTGVIDTGVIDSGMADTGLIDAGTEDTGVLDADFLDTGLLDAGSIDAGSIDADLPDTGTVLADAGTFDGGAPDTGIVLMDANVLPDTGIVLMDASVTDSGLRDAFVLGDGALRDAGRDAAPRRDAARDAFLADAPRGDASGDGGPHLGPAPVDLGPITDLSRAGAYVLIAKTGITNVTGSMISGGHLGVSPIFSPAITGFTLILDPSGQFSTSIAVVSPWRVYAADYAVPTPTNLTSAILDMERAYSDASSRVLPDFLNLVDGHIGGLVLVPGLYTWMSSVDVTAPITFLGGPNDVWILQVTNDVDLSAATDMLLAGGAQASNIFWSVAGQVTTHSDSHFEGVILCQTGITMQTGASMHGRALAQTLVALDDNMIVAP